jgi:hypothetical protein
MQCFVVVYDVPSRLLTYMSPSVDFDTLPLWLPDSQHLVFMRRPGLAFGQQAQQGTGSLGNPNGPALPGTTATGRGGRGGGRGGQGGGGQDESGSRAAVNETPGLMRATFRGGHTLAFYRADVTTGEAEEIWHNQPNDQQVTNFNNVRFTGTHIVYPYGTGGGRGRGAAAAQGPADEWDRYYALASLNPAARPVRLTTTDGRNEDQTTVEHSSDAKSLDY